MLHMKNKNEQNRKCFKGVIKKVNLLKKFIQMQSENQSRTKIFLQDQGKINQTFNEILRGIQ